MRIYPASKAAHAHWWQALRASGLNISASWIDAPFNHGSGEPKPVIVLRRAAQAREDANVSATNVVSNVTNANFATP